MIPNTTPDGAPFRRNKVAELQSEIRSLSTLITNARHASYKVRARHKVLLHRRMVLRSDSLRLGASPEVELQLTAVDTAISGSHLLSSELERIESSLNSRLHTALARLAREGGTHDA
jgi:hypothetical protein